MLLTRGAVWICLTLALGCASAAMARDEPIEASDPTKIHTDGGGRLKYTDYSNGASMWELRANGNVGITDKDMLLFEFGYGQHDGDPVSGLNNGLTIGRLHYCQLFFNVNVYFQRMKGRTEAWTR